MNVPPWLAAELDKAGAQHAAREISRPQAVTALRDAILANADQVFIRGLAADFAARALESWQRRNRRDGAVALAAQSDLFPGLPARLYIRPGRAKAVILFTARDWDTARAMLATRTQGSIQAAQADWAAFEAAYQKARPLLTGGLTTADVQFELQHPGEAQASASPA